MVRTVKVNQMAHKIVNEILESPETLGIKVTKMNNGGTIIDCGLDTRGGYEVGGLITEICLGGLGKTALTMMPIEDMVLPALTVTTDSPAIATLASQAGYPLYESKETIATCSGPARVLARKPKELFDLLDIDDDSKVGVLVLQADEMPSEEMCKNIAGVCGIEPKSLFIIVTPLRSVAGLTQIAGRAIEDVAFTMWEILHFDVRRIMQMIGTAPIAPLCTNSEMQTFPDDFLCYGGTVYMTIEAGSEDFAEMAQKLVFETTPIFGKTFSQLLKEARSNFKRIPGYPGIFRPARVVINEVKSGKIHRAGDINPIMIRKCLGLSEPEDSD